ncbi:MAG: SufD family Fe-S cluster assembly protein [Candidatus Absconditabacteria bacterium]|nr:SufD family Fe-S cluster assembly protein [Candidatus Absconditabacteria bacterium]MDD3868028.1 SufD family Fe-S cluster assembly protein [Candidatus Absconditabacteria bacterium]MDD4714275.1 SufD family Fe-S cluster assembly protein [Candidatus Absconditabacteria bacterium]
MTELFYNPQEKSYLINQHISRIDCFENTTQTLTINLDEQADLTYAIFLKSSDLDITLQTQKEKVNANFFAFVCADEDQLSQLKVTTILKDSFSEIHVRLVAIQPNKATTSLDGSINILADVEKVSGHLLEEVLLLGENSSVTLKPILNVSSPDVKASHAAKLHRVDKEKLFYMQSKGLSASTAKKMMINSFITSILDHFELSPEQNDQIYSFIPQY